LLDQAEQKPEKILQIYEGADVSVRLLLIKARKKGTIKIDESGFYRYGNVVLGMSEKASVDWLQDRAHKHIIEMIEKETNPEYFVKDEPVAKSAEVNDPETKLTDESVKVVKRGEGTKK
jgi:hypothetical protein